MKGKKGDWAFCPCKLISHWKPKHLASTVEFAHVMPTPPATPIVLYVHSNLDHYTWTTLGTKSRLPSTFITSPPPSPPTIYVHNAFHFQAKTEDDFGRECSVRMYEPNNMYAAWHCSTIHNGLNHGHPYRTAVRATLERRDSKKFQRTFLWTIKLLRGIRWLVGFCTMHSSLLARAEFLALVKCFFMPFDQTTTIMTRSIYNVWSHTPI